MKAIYLKMFITLIVVATFSIYQLKAQTALSGTAAASNGCAPKAGAATPAGTQVGCGAGASNTDANSTFIGGNAGFSNTSGVDNTFTGYIAGYSNTGSHNTFTGMQAGNHYTTGSYNAGFGTNALYYNVTGSYNSALGTYAGQGTSGYSYSNCCFIGYVAGFLNTGNNNNFIGYQSGYSNTTGTNNTALGFDAGYKITTGSHNVFLGDSAGASTSQVGTTINSMALGYKTYTNLNNQFVYGNASVAQHIFQAGNVGINTQSPYQRLSVVGSGSFTDTLYANGKFYGSGINDTNGHATNSFVLMESGTKKEVKRVPLGMVAWGLNGNSATTSNFIGTTTNVSMRFRTNNTQRMIIDSLGNLGIGYKTPYAKLDIETADTSAAIIVRNSVYDSIQFRVGGNGYVVARDIQVKTGIILPDYVFEKNYKLQSLSEVEKYINENKHLPDIPSAAEVKKNGINVAEMDASLLKKVEEQTLYIIDLQKQINEMQLLNKQTQEQNKKMQKEIDLLKK